MTNDEFRVLPLESTGDGGQQWEDSGSTVTRSVLDNGLRIITQKIPATRSLALSWWVGAGSRDEDQDSAGSTHFLEHLLFKGTARRSAFDIAQAFDAVGGESNAETGKEHTNYWARVLSDDTAMAIDVLGDMISGSLIDPDEFETERGVILDELAMSEDNPPEVVHEAYQLAVFGDNSLGRPVGGSQETMRSVRRDDVWDYYQRIYAPSSLIIAAAGDVNHDEIVEKVCRSLSGAWSEELSRAQSPRPRRSTQMTNSDEYQPERVTRYRHIEQAHVIVGGPSMRAGDDRRPVMSVLLSILGGSMSSRLFQEIREKRGLAYSTYAFDSAYSNAGAWGMYAGTSPERITEVEKLMLGELEKLAIYGPSEEELIRVRGQLRGGMALGLEDTLSRMSRLGRSELNGRYFTVDAALARIERVQAEDVRALAEELAGRSVFTAEVLPGERQ